jgi:hypothetical protein
VHVNNCIPRTTVVGGYYGSATVRPRPPPQRFPRQHSTTRNYQPIPFIFGEGIGYGKISTPIVFGRFPISKMAAGGHFGKKIKIENFCAIICFRQFRAKKFFFFFSLLKFLDLENFRTFFFQKTFKTEIVCTLHVTNMHRFISYLVCGH